MADARGRLYNTIWRWHFYAGLFVAPFILILAITGGLYLFQDKVDELLYAKLFNIEAGTESVSADKQLEAALAEFPGSKPLAYIPPASATKSALVRLQTQNWHQMLVAVNPYSGVVIGSIDYKERFMGVIREIHGQLLWGKKGRAIMELSASWAMVLIITGLYMWWPRNGNLVYGIIIPRLNAKGRAFWKDIHAVTGFWVSMVLIFLIITGMPWSFAAGKLIHMVEGSSAPQTGLGWDGGGSQTIKSAAIEQGWANDHAQHLAGSAHSEHSFGSKPLSLEEITSIARNTEGVQKEFEIRLPINEHGVFTIVNNSQTTPETTAYIHLDQYSGKVLSQVLWKNFGTLSKGIALGVALHEGRYLGWANQLVNLAACAGLILMVVAGFVMWWKRRAKGTLSAPRKSREVKIGKALIALIILMGVIMPMLGISLIIIITGEWLFAKFTKNRRA